MSQSTITPATPEDVPAILGLINELAKFEKLSHQVDAEVDTLTKSLFGDIGSTEAVLIRHDGQPAGYCIYFYNFSTFRGKHGIYIEDLYISPKYRRNGLAKKTLNYVIALAKERDCARVDLSVLDWNENAIKLYDSMGFQPKHDWVIYRLEK